MLLSILNFKIKYLVTFILQGAEGYSLELRTII